MDITHRIYRTNRISTEPVILFILLTMHRRLVLAGITTVLSILFTGCTSGEVAGQCDSDTTLGLVVHAHEPAFERVRVTVTENRDTTFSEVYELDGDGDGSIAHESDVFRHGNSYIIEAVAGNETATEDVEIDCFGIGVEIQQDEVELFREHLEG